MVNKKIVYKRIKKGERYIVQIHGLMDWMEGEFRVNLREEYGPLAEIFDVNLCRADHRKQLEDYVSGLQDCVKIVGVYFSSTGLMGDNYYELDSFKRQYSFLSDKRWFQNLTVPTLKR